MARSCSLASFVGEMLLEPRGCLDFGLAPNALSDELDRPEFDLGFPRSSMLPVSKNLSFIGMITILLALILSRKKKHTEITVVLSDVT